MIIDRIEKLVEFFSENDQKMICDFIEIISPDMEEGIYYLDGKRIYARVMSYHTSLKDDCKIEAHDKYIDIQSTLVGSEGIEIFHRDELTEESPYDKENDVVFYNETASSYLLVNNLPGWFSLIYPNEAHRPQISINEKCEVVKKFVIKVRVE